MGIILALVLVTGLVGFVSLMVYIAFSGVSRSDWVEPTVAPRVHVWAHDGRRTP